MRTPTSAYSRACMRVRGHICVCPCTLHICLSNKGHGHTATQEIICTWLGGTTQPLSLNLYDFPLHVLCRRVKVRHCPARGELSVPHCMRLLPWFPPYPFPWFLHYPFPWFPPCMFPWLLPCCLFVCFPGCQRCCLAGQATWEHFKEHEILTNYARSCCAQPTNTWRKRLLKPKNSQGAWLWFGFGPPVNRKEIALFIHSFFGLNQEDCIRTAKGTDRAPRRRAWEERN